MDASNKVHIDIGILVLRLYFPDYQISCSYFPNWYQLFNFWTFILHNKITSNSMLAYHSFYFLALSYAFCTTEIKNSLIMILKMIMKNSPLILQKQ